MNMAIKFAWKKTLHFYILGDTTDILASDHYHWTIISNHSRWKKIKMQHLISFQAPWFNISPQSKSCLTSLQVLIFVSHLNPCDVSATSNSYKLYFSSIQTPSRILYVLFTSIPVLYQLHSDHKILVSTPSMLCLTSDNIHISKYHLQSCGVSSPSRYRYLHLIPIQVVQHLKPALIIYSPPSYRSQLIPIQVEIWISHPSPSRLIFTKAPIFTSHRHPGRVSPPPMSRYLYLNSIPGMNQLFPVHENCISALFRSIYKDMQVSKCMSSVHPMPASPAPKSPNSGKPLIYVLYHLHPGR